MLTRHQNELYNRLEALQELGYAMFTRWELLTWFGMEKFGINIWRGIADKWKEIDDEHPLFVGTIGNKEDVSARFVFIYAQGLTASEKAWFKPLDGYIKKEAT